MDKLNEHFICLLFFRSQHDGRRRCCFCRFFLSHRMHETVLRRRLSSTPPPPRWNRSERAANFLALWSSRLWFSNRRCRFEILVTVVASSSPSPVFLFLRSIMSSSFLARLSARCLRCLSASVSILTSLAVLTRLLSEVMVVNDTVDFFLRRLRCRLDIADTVESSSSSSPAFLRSCMASNFLARASALSLRLLYRPYLRHDIPRTHPFIPTGI